jgi:hypothetical protein
MATEDFSQLSKPAQLLRLYCVQALDHLTQDEISQNRDLIQESLIPVAQFQVNSRSTAIVKIGQILLQDSPSLTFTTTEGIVCCDQVGLIASGVVGPSRITALTVLTSDWKEKDNYSQVLERRFGGIRSKTRKSCTLEAGCKLKKYRGQLIHDRLSPILWVVFEHPLKCQTASDLGIFSPLVLTVWVGYLAVYSDLESIGNERRMVRLQYQARPTLIWFIETFIHCFVRVEKDQQIWHYDNQSDGKAERKNSWLDGIDLETTRVVAVFSLCQNPSPTTLEFPTT